MIELFKYSFSHAETPIQYIMTIVAPIIALAILIGFIQLFYNVATHRNPSSQSPHWLGNVFYLFIKILRGIVKIASWILMGAVWIYYKTRIVLYIIKMKLLGRKPDLQ